MRAFSSATNPIAPSPAVARLTAIGFVSLMALGSFSCSNAMGTIEIQIEGDAGLLASIHRAEVFTDDPRYQEEAVRDENGDLLIAFSFPSAVVVTTVHIRGFDLDDALVATGVSLPVSLAAVDAAITIEMTDPNTAP